ncbi:MAG: acyltransferase family protein [Chloroflexota bacterium]
MSAKELGGEGIGLGKRQRDLRIDILKGLAIAAVLVQHSLDRSMLQAIGGSMYALQAVGVFMIIAGYNSASSYARHNVNSIADGYRWSVMSRSLSRLMLPYLLIWAVEAVLAGPSGASSVGDYVVYFVTGGWGWGAYFMPVIVLHVLLFPFVYRLGQRAPKWLLPMALALDLAFEAIVYVVHLQGLPAEPLYLRFLYPRYLFAIALGVWLATGRRSRKAIFIAGALSGVYVAALEYGGVQVPMDMVWASRAAPAVPWALACVVAGLLFLPRLSGHPVWRGLAAAGRASYHTFLIQSVYFWHLFARDPGVGQYGQALVLIVVLSAAGWLFYRAELKVRDALARRPVVAPREPPGPPNLPGPAPRRPASASAIGSARAGRAAPVSRGGRARGAAQRGENVPLDPAEVDRAA